MSTTTVAPGLTQDGLLRSRPLFAYLGHHKCASTWLSDIARGMCVAAGLRVASVNSPRGFDGRLDQFVAERRLDFLIYSNANLRFVSSLSDFRAFHVVRDPRDVVVSSYYSHLYSHPTEGWPELGEHRRRLRAVGKDEGIYLVIDFLAGVFDEMLTWDYDQPNVLELRMEDVTRSPEVYLHRAFQFLGLIDEAVPSSRAMVARVAASIRRVRRRMVPFQSIPLPADLLDSVLRRNAFQSKANGRTTGVENVSSHYRKGVAGDWVNHFNSGHKEFFKSRHSDLLLKLGYERDSDW